MSSEEETQVEEVLEEQSDADLNENSDIIIEVIEPRCYWCNKSEPEIQELLECRYQKRNQEEVEMFLSCSKEHEHKTTKFLRFNERFYFLYIAFMFAFPVILLAIAFIIPTYIFSIGFSLFISMGIGLMIMPLLGNQIVMNIGLKKSNILGRILGLILLIIGVILILTFGLNFFN
jgi:hypothetical protein